MDRREAVLALVALFAATASYGQPRTVRIGYLAPGRQSVFLAPLLKRMAELGYVQGKNLTIEYRSADGDLAKFPALARDLVDIKCDLVIAVGTEHPAQAMQRLKTQTPVVLIAVTYDPVKLGVVPNLRQPGGNVTGMWIPIPELAAKHLELMRQILPTAKRFLVFGDSLTPEQLENVTLAARRLRVELKVEVFNTPPPYDLEPAFVRGKAAGAEGLIVLDSRSFFDQRARVAALAMKHRLPAVVNVHYFDQEGFLIAYGADFHRAFIRVGDIAASILNGKKPGDIPLEQPSEFDLLVNQKAARSLGISVPGPILARANRIIE
jgi:putative ABC transport system substrate-binding protein